MFFELLKIGFILLIAVPFLVMFYEVIMDISKRSWQFFSVKAKPVLISVITTLSRP